MTSSRRTFLQFAASILLPLSVLNSTSKATTPSMIRAAATVELHYPLTLNANDLCLPDDEDQVTSIDRNVPLIAELDGRFIDVDQLISAEAVDPLEMFKFSPGFVELNPGDTIRFMNSMGQHTVVSIKGMLPDGAKPFQISHQKIAEIQFNHPGVYGIRCKVHTRYGMVMLVKVGDTMPNLEKAKAVKHGRMAKKRFKQLFEKLEKAIA